MAEFANITAELEAILQEGGLAEKLAPKEKEQFLANIEDAIMMELASELLDGLTPDGKALLEEKHFEGYADLLEFLRKMHTVETYNAAVARATDRVIKDVFAPAQA